MRMADVIVMFLRWSIALIVSVGLIALLFQRGHPNASPGQRPARSHRSRLFSGF